MVGTAICRHGGNRGCGVTRVPSGLTRMCHWLIASTSSTPSARHTSATLTVSMTVPPPMLTIRSARVSRSRRVSAMTVSRGVCSMHSSNRPTTWAFTVASASVTAAVLRLQRAAGHDEHPLRAALRHLGGDALGRADAEVHALLRQEVEDSGSHHLLLQNLFAPM